MSKIFWQILTRFSTSDSFLAVLKISTEHGSRVPVGSCFGNRKQHWTKSSGKLFLLFIVTNLLPLLGLARKSIKHNLKFLEISKSRALKFFCVLETTLSCSKTLLSTLNHCLLRCSVNSAAFIFTHYIGICSNISRKQIYTHFIQEVNMIVWISSSYRAEFYGHFSKPHIFIFIW